MHAGKMQQATCRQEKGAARALSTLGCARMHAAQVGKGKVVRVSGVAAQGRTATVLLRGSNKLVLEEAERSLHDALCAAFFHPPACLALASFTLSQRRPSARCTTRCALRTRAPCATFHSHRSPSDKGSGG
jgi:hypothetical protein